MGPPSSKWEMTSEIAGRICFRGGSRQVYSYRDISVGNEGMLDSAEWPEVTFTMLNS